MKKILFFTRPIVPPWDEASKNLAYEIARTADGDFEMHLLSTKGGQFEVVNTHGHPVVTERIFSSAGLHGREKFELMQRIWRRDMNADIIHFLFTPRPLTSWLLKTRLRRTAIKTIQTIATVDSRLFGQPELLDRLFFSDALVVQSRYTLDRLKNAGIDRAQLIYPGIDLNKYRPRPKDNKLLQQLKLSLTDFVVLFPGEYTRLKAIDDIVAGFQQLFAKDSSIKLALACRIKSDEDRRKKALVMEYFRRMGYNDRVTYIDLFGDMPSLYNVSDLVIFPVREMAGKFDIPLAVIEPMACRKPVVVTDIPVLEEFVKDGITGLVVKKGMPEQLAGAVEKIKADTKLREEISENAAKFVQLTFGIDNCVKKYEEIYKRL